jgi:hypothetical protein
LLQRLGRTYFLLAAAFISITSYCLELTGFLSVNAWYFIILLEIFNFALGMVLGQQFHQEETRKKIDLFLFKKSTQVLAFILIIVGNLCNWFLPLYPFSSGLFTIGLFVLGMNLSVWLMNFSFFKWLSKLNSYNLYLIHQPFATLVALSTVYILHGYAAFFGLFLYFFVIFGLTIVFSQSVAWLESKAVFT